MFWIRIRMANKNNKTFAKKPYPKVHQIIQHWYVGSFEILSSLTHVSFHECTTFSLLTTIVPTSDFFELNCSFFLLLYASTHENQDVTEFTVTQHFYYLKGGLLTIIWTHFTIILHIYGLFAQNIVKSFNIIHTWSPSLHNPQFCAIHIIVLLWANPLFYENNLHNNIVRLWVAQDQRFFAFLWFFNRRSGSNHLLILKCGAFVVSHSVFVVSFTLFPFCIS